MKRKSPIRHRVKPHRRKNRPVREHFRGKGLRGERIYVFRKRLRTKTTKLRMPGGSRLIPIDTPIAKNIKEVWKKGWKTSEACSSHVGAHIAPYVDFSSVPRLAEPNMYRPLEVWFRKNVRKLKLNHNWNIEDGSIFVIESDGSRINDFTESVGEQLHKELVNDLNRILISLPRREHNSQKRV